MKSSKPADGPDISAIVRDVANNGGINQPAQRPIRNQTPAQADSPTTQLNGRLWDEFIEILNEEEESTDRTKLYAIDDDIVETLHQCNFGKPNVHVINSILRTFLVDNIDRLRQMHRPRSRSLLDKY